MITEVLERAPGTTDLVLSVSRKAKFEQCGYAYKLYYVDKAWQRPAAWLAQGLAVHEAVEAYEKSLRTMTREEVLEATRESYAKHVSRMTEDTPNFNFWFWSGPYSGEADVERRFDIAEAMSIKYIDWVEDHPEEEIWVTPDGKLAIELPFNIEIEGVKVRGFIDQVIKVGDKLIGRDVKTGNKPGDRFQLDTYSLALETIFPGIEVNKSDFWMGKTGKPTLPVYHDELTRNDIPGSFKDAYEGITEQRFEPNPGKHCRFCSVSSSCEYAQ